MGDRTDADPETQQPWYVRSFGADYAERYAHRDPAEARLAVQTLAGHLNVTDGVVLDLCCGAGRHIQPLLSAGARRVIGVDLSADLLAIARDHLGEELAAGRAELRRGDMRDVPLDDASVDAVASFFTSFGYFDDPADDQRVLAGIARMLRPGARYALDFMNADVTIAGLVAEDTTRFNGETLTNRRHYDATTQRIEKVVLGSDGREVAHESVRAWRPAELREMATAAGLRVIEELGTYSGAPFVAPTSPRFIAIFERTEPGS